MACVEACTEGAHRNENGKHVLEFDLCKTHGKCASACLYDALTLIGHAREVAEIMGMVEADSAYYESSGGGITLSGGEPMAQFGFVRELLQACRDKGIHTCIETCGFAGQEQYAELLPLVDVFLFDYKEDDPARHAELTGVSNERILSNLDYLYQNGAAIILRCPIVPGLNDSMEHLEAIAGLSRRYPNLLGVEIMAYHDMGNDKSVRIGRTLSSLANLKTTDEAKKAEWLMQLERLGEQRVKIG